MEKLILLDMLTTMLITVYSNLDVQLMISTQVGSTFAFLQGKLLYVRISIDATVFDYNTEETSPQRLPSSRSVESKRIKVKFITFPGVA